MDQVSTVMANALVLVDKQELSFWTKVCVYQSAYVFILDGVAWLTLQQDEELYNPIEPCITASALINQEEPDEVVQTLYKDAPWSSPTRTVSDMSHWKETRDLLEILYLTVGLESLGIP